MKFKRLDNKNYLKHFGEEFVYVDDENFTLGIFPNEHDDFRFVTFVNGLDVKRGGNHIDLVVEEVSNKLRDKLQRKHKSIKPGDIKNKLFVVLIIKNYPLLKFDSQTKETVENSKKDIKEFLNIDFDTLVNNVYKEKSIITPIVEIFQAKELIKAKSELKKTVKKKIISDKYWRATKNNKYLMICEGDSARGSVSSSLGREEFSYYSMKGKPLNVINNSIQKFNANKELTELMNIINNDTPEFVIYTTDKDLDGIHIQVLLMGFVKTFFPNLLKSNRVGRLETPLMVNLDKDNNILDYYFDIESQQNAKKNPKRASSRYLKGLGSLDDGFMDEIIKREGLENIIQIFEIDDLSVIDNWMKDENVQFRKDRIKENEFSIVML